MPHFYFHLRSPAGLEHDEVGLDFVDLEAAYLDACDAIPAISADLVTENADPSRHRFEIADEAGQLLMTVPFLEILDRGRRPSRPLSPALMQRTHAEAERTLHLCASIAEQHDALRSTLRRTRELVAQVRAISGQGSITGGSR